MLGCGGTLSYMTISKHLFSGDLIFIAKFFVGLLIIITIGVLGFLLVKFRILLITKQKMIVLNPFILRLKTTDLKNINKYKWTNWDIKATVFRTIEIKLNNGDKIKISDFEFENFDYLVTKLPGKTDSKEKSEVDLKQAKANLSNMAFNIWIFLGLIGLIAFLNITEKGFHWIHLIIYSISSIMIYASQKRRKKYKLKIKTAYNK